MRILFFNSILTMCVFSWSLNAKTIVSNSDLFLNVGNKFVKAVSAYNKVEIFNLNGKDTISKLKSGDSIFIYGISKNRKWFLVKYLDSLRITDSYYYEKNDTVTNFIEEKANDSNTIYRYVKDDTLISKSVSGNKDTLLYGTELIVIDSTVDKYKLINLKTMAMYNMTKTGFIRGYGNKLDEEMLEKYKQYKFKELGCKVFKITGKFKAAVLKGQVIIGMTRDMVEVSWGIPEEKNRTVGSWGVHEQWVYKSTYLYFENNILTSFQDQF